MAQRETNSLAGVLVLSAIFVGSVVLALLASRNNILPNNDEIYHLLAARGLQESGDFSVGLGAYPRASAYTRYIAAGFALAGESLNVAKAMTALSFGLLIASVFAFLRRRVGAATAALSCSLLALAPHSLEFATTVRFYMPQAVLFWIGAVCLYRAVAESGRPQFLLPIALASWLLATHLQPVTVVGIGAVLIWVFLYGLYRYLDGELLPGYQPTRTHLIAVVVAALGALAALYLTGILEAAIAQYTTAAEWNRGSRIQYYYWVMTEYYNPFWSVLPIAAILALVRYPALGGFAICVFAVSFVTLSFAGMKEDRYLYFSFPFFFLLIGIGIAETFAIVRSLARSVIEGLPGAGIARAGALAGPVSAVALTFFVISNLGYVSVAKDLVGGTAKRVQPRWDLLADRYGDQLRESRVLLTNRPNYSLYYLDRMPVSIGLSRLKDLGPDAEEFSIDYRTGAVLIGVQPSLARILACVESGLLVAEQRQWNRNPRTGVSGKMIPTIESNMERIELPKDWGLRLYRWDRFTRKGSPVPSEGVDCASLNVLLADARALAE